MTPENRTKVTAGYQDMSRGRGIAPRPCWSDAAFQYALGIPQWRASPTAAQRNIGITGFDQHGRAIFDGKS